MSDKDLIERLWREAAYVKPLSKGAYEALTDAADALEAAGAERDAALARVAEIEGKQDGTFGPKTKAMLQAAAQEYEKRRKASTLALAVRDLFGEVKGDE